MKRIHIVGLQSSTQFNDVKIKRKKNKEEKYKHTLITGVH